MQVEQLAHSSTGISIGAFGFSLTLTGALQVIALIVAIVAGIVGTRLSITRNKYLKNKMKEEKDESL